MTADRNERAREVLARITEEQAPAGRYVARDIRAGNMSPENERAIAAMLAFADQERTQEAAERGGGERETGPNCPNCRKPVEVGQVVLSWDDAGEMHADCERPFSLDVERGDDQPEPVVLLGHPMRYFPVAAILSTPSDHDALVEPRLADNGVAFAVSNAGVDQALRNELETIRCHLLNFPLDVILLQELVELRERVPAPAEVAAVERRRKSQLIEKIEARLVFGEYCEREERRLGRLAEAMQAGPIPEADRAAFADERQRNEEIARRAIAMEEAADALTALRTGGGA